MRVRDKNKHNLLEGVIRPTPLLTNCAHISQRSKLPLPPQPSPQLPPQSPQASSIPYSCLVGGGEKDGRALSGDPAHHYHIGNSITPTERNHPPEEAANGKGGVITPAQAVDRCHVDANLAQLRFNLRRGRRKARPLFWPKQGK